MGQANRAAPAAPRAVAVGLAVGLALAGGLAPASPALAQGGADKDWPCQQRRQPQLSLAQLWSGPLPDDAATALAATPEVQALAQRLALRRLALPEAEAMVRDYAAARPPEARAQALTALFVASFGHLSAERDRVMSGITRYARKQQALDGTIRTARADFTRLSAADPPDYDAIDAAETQLDWALRVFDDRRQSLSYVCETPVLLEQRAFALGRAMAAALPPAP